MKSVLDILNEIANESSTKKKEAILSLHRDNDDLKESFRLAYDKRLSFGISKVPEEGMYEKNESISAQLELSDMLFGLQMLIDRDITGHNARDWLGNRVSLMKNPDDAEVIRRIIDRDLKCGIGRTVPNKVWKDLIPKQPQMLCNPMNEKNLSRIKYPAYAQLKADGARCFLDVVWDTTNETVEVTMVSRAGNDYYGLEHIKEEIKNELLNNCGHIRPDIGGNLTFTIDGELICIDECGDHVERSINNGILNKSLKGTISPEEAKNVHFISWDFINTSNISYKIVKLNGSNIIHSICNHHEKATTREDWERFGDRYTNLCKLIDGLIFILPTENDIVHNLDEARIIFKKYVDQGYEGIILKNMYAPWKDGRSNDQVKFKEEFFIDMEVVGFIENDTYPNTLGSLQLRSKCGTIEANCGSGFTYTFQKKVGKEWIPIPLNERPYNDRGVIWEDQEVFLGKIAEIKCNAWTTSDGRETKSLFLPIFERWRFDKTDANTFDEVW